MYKIIKYACLVLVVASLASCKCTQQAFVPVTDTVTVIKTVIERDTVIVAPKAEISVKIPLKDLVKAAKNGQYSHEDARDKQANLSVEVKDDLLNINCQCDTISIAAKLRDIYEKEERKQVIQLPPVQVKYIPWYIQALAWVGGIALAWVGGLIYYKIRKN